MTNQLEVWFFDQHVGDLFFAKGKLEFSYLPSYLNHPNALALSISLPLQETIFIDSQVRPFFAGLLPEGQLRRTLAKQLQVSNQNDFVLLDLIGGECAGAVSLREPHLQLKQTKQLEFVKWLNQEEILSILNELPNRPMMAGTDGLRLSLAGAQDKLPVVFDGQRIGLPMNGMASTHILKPPILAVKDSVINEGFCLALAQSLGLLTAQADIMTIQGNTFLLVERYDRFINESGLRVRVHQEDFCQALGFIPELKYQNEGGPDLARCFDLIRKIANPSATQLLKFFDYVIFNTLVGNHDAHAKNFSWLYTQKIPTLAPFYDVLSTAIYPKLTPKIAMKIGSKYKFTEIQLRHWESFIQSAGLANAQAKKRILYWANCMPKAARELQENSKYSFSKHEIVEQIVQLIEHRSALTEKRILGHD